MGQLIDNMSYRVYSPAKLNLGLQIIGRNSAGLHILNSIFSKISLYDIIDLDIQYHHTNIMPLANWHLPWHYQEDLVYKAALCLQQYSKVKFGLKFKIKKNIPVGSGLGGGSSNAATTLYYLNILWQLFYPQEVLIQLAQTLGEDVSFFLYNSSSLYYNFIHHKVKLPHSYFVLVIPKKPINTKMLFDVVRAQQSCFKAQLTCSELYVRKNNDLLEYAKNINDNVHNIIKKANKYGINLSMTGSGSVLYLSCNNMVSAGFYTKILAKILFGFYNSIKVVRGIEKNPSKCDWI